MKITDVLVAEHAAFARVFDLVERALAACGTVAEVRMLAGLVEGLLHHHGAAEENLRQNSTAKHPAARSLSDAA